MAGMGSGEDVIDGTEGYAQGRSRLRFLHNRRGKLLVCFIVLGIVFAAIAILQHWFVHDEADRTADQELALWASQVSSEIAYRDKWDLRGYRNAAINVPSWYVLGQDGLVIDIEGDIPWVLGRAQMITGLNEGSPQTVVTKVSEAWRLLARRVEGGRVIVGIFSPEDIKEADKELLSNIEKFGTTLRKAASTRSREIDWDVDYVVLSSTGELINAYGGVPLRAAIRELPVRFGRRTTVTITKGKKFYRLYGEPILGRDKQPVGMIIVSKDMTLQEQAMHLQDRFNTLLIIFSLAVSLVLAVMITSSKLSRRHSTLTVEEALKVGESKTVEFKSAFHWDTRLGQAKDERRLDVLKSIAGFLNTDGGNLYIGVEEDKFARPSLRGLEEDLALAHHSKDQLQRSLRDLITARIGSQFSPFITDRIEEVQGKLCWIVTVEPSRRDPVFVRWRIAGEKEQKKFFVREGPKTSDLDNELTWRYIKNKWG
jgi:hypothetical protein